MAHPLWQILLKEHSSLGEPHLSCGECFALLEFIVDAILVGQEIGEIQEMAGRHLALCPDCQKEFAEMLGTWEGAFKSE